MLPFKDTYYPYDIVFACIMLANNQLRQCIWTAYVFYYKQTRKLLLSACCADELGTYAGAPFAAGHC